MFAPATKPALAMACAVTLAAALLHSANASAQPATKTVKAAPMDAIKRGPDDPPPPPPPNPCNQMKWDSTEIQNQIGSKNKDKKKLVMRVEYSCWKGSGNTWHWRINYLLKSEDKDLVGSGWHPGSAPSLTYTITYKTGAQSNTASGTVGGAGSLSMLKGGQVTGAANLPVFTARNFRGVRAGGSSGIAINWP